MQPEEHTRDKEFQLCERGIIKPGGELLLVLAYVSNYVPIEDDRASTWTCPVKTYQTNQGLIDSGGQAIPTVSHRSSNEENSLTLPYLGVDCRSLS
ncbi:hypothetical protein KQX54_021085 [Cotesia glomerata]|uniref:Uncharacterized protein n=1 Tax=Cotesia glomerata TaxID=32391 RepID=A0AAV7J849_COTGL|nr:hypothetical protein KQX54_021085 [Cotesia glomerata]